MAEDKRAKAFGDSAGRGPECPEQTASWGGEGRGLRTRLQSKAGRLDVDSRNKHVWKTSGSHEEAAHVLEPQRKPDNKSLWLPRP